MVRRKRWFQNPKLDGLQGGARVASGKTKQGGHNRLAQYVWISVSASNVLFRVMIDHTGLRAHRVRDAAQVPALLACVDDPLASVIADDVYYT